MQFYRKCDVSDLQDLKLGLLKLHLSNCGKWVSLCKLNYEANFINLEK